MLVPFEAISGHMLPHIVTDPYRYQERGPFHSVLRYVKSSNIGYSRRYWWEDVFTNKRYVMMLRYFDQTLKSGSIQESKGLIVDGKWDFAKVGDNYSIKPVLE